MKGFTVMKNLTYWKPKKKNDIMEGLFSGFFATEFEEGKGKNSTIRKGMNINLVKGDNIISFGLNSVLKNKFKTIIPSLKEKKTKIKIVFLGKEKGKKYTFNNFDLFVNGKLVESSKGKAPASKEEINSFFAE